MEYKPNKTDKYIDGENIGYSEEIRPPDDVKRVCLINDYADDYHDYHFNNDTELENVLGYSLENSLEFSSRNMLSLREEELDEVLAKSKQEYEEQINMMLEQIREKECEERKKRFKNAKTQILRFHKIDKANTDVYSLLLDGIDLFEQEDVKQYPLDSMEKYLMLESVLKTLRITRQEREDLLIYFTPFAITFSGFSPKNTKP